MRATILSILCVAVVLSVMPLCAESNDAVEKTLQSKEQAGWQAWKDQNAQAFADFLPEQSINIVDGAMQKGKQDIVKAASTGCTVNSFSLSDFSYIWLNKDAVIMTYTANQDATCGGKKVPAKVLASSVWEKKSGKWLSPFHQESPVGGM